MMEARWISIEKADVVTVAIEFAIEAASQKDVVRLKLDELKVEQRLQLRAVHKIIGIVYAYMAKSIGDIYDHQLVYSADHQEKINNSQAAMARSLSAAQS